MEYKNILKQLNSLSEPSYKEFNSKIVLSKQKMLGVRLPLLRTIAKELSTEYSQNLKLFKKDENIYEMVLLEGLILSYAKDSFLNLKAETERYLSKVDSWAQIDSVMLGFKSINKDKDEALDVLLEWIVSDKEFVVRSALVGLLGFYADEELLDSLFKLSEEVEHKGYYVMMANAWLISVCMAKFPNQTFEFFKNNTLDDKTHNTAIQKSIDSFRVSKEDKDLLRGLKRRRHHSLI